MTALMDELTQACERERDYLRRAHRCRNLAREAAYFGEDDFYDYLAQAECYEYLAHLCGQAADDVRSELAHINEGRSTQ